MIPAIPLYKFGGARARGGVALLAALSLAVAGCTSHAAGQAAGATHPASSVASPAADPATAASAGSPTTASSAHPAPLRTVAPAPHGGNVHQHVPSGVARTAAPVPLTSTAHFGHGLSVQVVKHATIHAKASGPGEISGAATALTIRFTNASPHPIDLSHVVVADQDADGTPLLSVSGRPARAVEGSIGAHTTKTAVYVFTLTDQTHNPYTFTISYSTAAPAVRLVGDAA